MGSLRTRFTILLMLAIVVVVVLATVASSWVLAPPRPEKAIVPVARQIASLIRMAEREPEALAALGARLAPEPLAGEPHGFTSDLLARRLARADLPHEVQVLHGRHGDPSWASVNLGARGWLIAEIPQISPPDDRWFSLAVLVTAIVAGVGLVSALAARAIARPLELLEGAVAQVGVDGILAPMPEDGPVETRATARALNRLSSQLRSAMESRMRLVAAAGHDLRTPMTRMRLRAEFIEDDEERARWLSDLEELDSIADSAIRLVREEASNLSGTEAAAPLRLDRLLGEIAADLRATGHDVQEISPLAPLSVTATPLALTRALRNLLINAATHGGGARIALRREGEHAVLSISDDGPGIPPELLGQVFEPFFRVDPSRRKTMPGAGLGLAIAREIIERFRGTLVLANRSPRGLEQRVSLPLA